MASGQPPSASPVPSASSLTSGAAPCTHTLVGGRLRGPTVLQPPAPQPAAAMVQQAAVACSSAARAPARQQQQQHCRRQPQRRMQAGGAAAAAPRRQLTRCSAAIKFAKYQGLGNDFILVSLWIGFQCQRGPLGARSCATSVCGGAGAGVGRLPALQSDCAALHSTALCWRRPAAAGGQGRQHRVSLAGGGASLFPNKCLTPTSLACLLAGDSPQPPPTGGQPPPGRAGGHP